MASPYLSLLETLRQHCELPEFPDPLPSNLLNLELKEGPTITINLNEETQYVEIFSPIGSYEEGQELEVLRSIAQANFLWAATAGATLSARPEEQTVYLAYQTPISAIEGEEFVHLVEQFVDVVQQWQQILKKINSGATVDETSEESTAADTVDKVDTELA
jgi:hypothetical protein